MVVADAAAGGDLGEVVAGDRDPLHARALEGADACSWSMAGSRWTTTPSSGASVRFRWEGRTRCSPDRCSGGERWAILASLINTAKLHDIDPETYLADVLDRIVSGRTKVNALRELLPVEWKAAREAPAAAAA